MNPYSRNNTLRLIAAFTALILMALANCYLYYFLEVDTNTHRDSKWGMMWIQLSGKLPGAVYWSAQKTICSFSENKKRNSILPSEKELEHFYSNPQDYCSFLKEKATMNYAVLGSLLVLGVVQLIVPIYSSFKVDPVSQPASFKKNCILSMQILLLTFASILALTLYYKFSFFWKSFSANMKVSWAFYIHIVILVTILFNTFLYWRDKSLASTSAAQDHNWNNPFFPNVNSPLMPNFQNQSQMRYGGLVSPAEALRGYGGGRQSMQSGMDANYYGDRPPPFSNINQMGLYQNQMIQSPNQFNRVPGMMQSPQFRSGFNPNFPGAQQRY